MTNFDAAIRVLRGHIKWAFFHRSCYPPCEGPDFRGDVGECHAAIRVLEAAGKVDKAKALDGLEGLRAMMSRALFMDAGPTFKSVRALLVALPDKEK